MAWLTLKHLQSLSELLRKPLNRGRGFVRVSKCSLDVIRQLGELLLDEPSGMHPLDQRAIEKADRRLIPTEPGFSCEPA